MLVRRWGGDYIECYTSRWRMQGIVMKGRAQAEEIQLRKERIEFAKYQRKIENHDYDPYAGHLSIECLRNGLEEAERMGTEKNLLSWINKGRRFKHMEVL